MTNEPQSDDTLPEGSIPLSTAYEIYYRVDVLNWRKLAVGLSGRSELAEGDEFPHLVEQAEAAWLAFEMSHTEAEKKFRQHLEIDAPASLVNNPVTGQVTELNRRQWGGDAMNFIPGFFEDFVGPGELQPGPNAVVNGFKRPVFFWREKFDQFMAGYRAGLLTREIGPAGVGRPHLNDHIGRELEDWIAGGTARIKKELDQWGVATQTKGVGQIARALCSWAVANCSPGVEAPAARTIETTFRGRIHDALKLI